MTFFKKWYFPAARPVQQNGPYGIQLNAIFVCFCDWDNNHEKSAELSGWLNIFMSQNISTQPKDSDL